MTDTRQQEAPYDRTFFEGISAGSRESARGVLPVALELFPCASAVDVGCGVGTWLRVLKELGVQDVLGVDGGYVKRDLLEIEQAEFRPFDLTKPLNVGRTFDLVMSLEVAEHLPPACADTFVESLTQLGPVVLFSAAIPFQLGTDHVNEQWPEFWAERFARRGYLAIDCVRDRVWHDNRISPWYRQNAILYASQEALSRNPSLRAAQQRTDPQRLTRVHPGVFVNSMGYMKNQLTEATDPREMSLKRLLKALPNVAMHAIKRNAKLGSKTSTGNGMERRAASTGVSE